MKRIQHSDWLPERARLAYHARSGFPALFPARKSSVFWPYNKFFIDRACSDQDAFTCILARSFLRFY